MPARNDNSVDSSHKQQFKQQQKTSDKNATKNILPHICKWREKSKKVKWAATAMET